MSAAFFLQKRKVLPMGSFLIGQVLPRLPLLAMGPRWRNVAGEVGPPLTRTKVWVFFWTHGSRAVGRGVSCCMCDHHDDPTAALAHDCRSPRAQQLQVELAHI